MQAGARFSVPADVFLIAPVQVLWYQ